MFSGLNEWRRGNMMTKKSLCSLKCGLCWGQLHLRFSIILPFSLPLFSIPSKQSRSEYNGCSDIKHKRIYELHLLLGILLPWNKSYNKKKKIIFQSWSTVLEFVKAFMRSCYLSGVLLLPCSFISNIISEESSGELALASRRSCSCWARYWAGVCLANRAQWSSSLCSRGRLAFSGKKQVRQTSLH